MKPSITTEEVEALKRRLSALHAEGRETQLERDLERAVTILHREMICECRARIMWFIEGIKRGQLGPWGDDAPGAGSDRYSVAVVDVRAGVGRRGLPRRPALAQEQRR